MERRKPIILFMIFLPIFIFIFGCGQTVVVTTATNTVVKQTLTNTPIMPTRTNTSVPPTNTKLSLPPTKPPTDTKIPLTATRKPSNTKKPSTKVPSIKTLGVKSNLVLYEFAEFDFEYGEDPSPGITRIVGTSPDGTVFFTIDVIDGYVYEGSIWATWRYSNEQVIYQNLDYIDLFRDTLLPNWSSSYQWMEKAMKEILDKLNSGKPDHGISTSLNNVNIQLYVVNSIDLMTLIIEAHK